MNSFFKKIMLTFLFVISSSQTFAAPCTGNFINPLNICWSCLFPLSIGEMQVKGGLLPDTKDNPSSPIGICPDEKLGARVGLNIGFWEPFAITDVTDTPYCLVNLGGLKLDLGLKRGQGGKQTSSNNHGAFYHVHWYKYPLLAWLNIITSVGCMQAGDFDIAYMTELDPTWNDSQFAFVLNPEAIFFGTPVAQVACAADAIATSANQLPIDELFWCAGSQGSMYPFSGHVSGSSSPVQTAILLSERMDYKMHRMLLIEDSNPTDDSIDNVCSQHLSPILKKSRYRYELMNPVTDGKHCYPFGHTTLDWEAGHIKPDKPAQYGALIWRKRNCTFL